MVRMNGWMEFFRQLHAKFVPVNNINYKLYLVNLIFTYSNIYKLNLYN